MFLTLHGEEKLGLPQPTRKNHTTNASLDSILEKLEDVPAVYVPTNIQD